MLLCQKPYEYALTEHENIFSSVSSISTTSAMSLDSAPHYGWMRTNDMKAAGTVLSLEEIKFTTVERDDSSAGVTRCRATVAGSSRERAEGGSTISFLLPMACSCKSPHGISLHNKLDKRTIQKRSTMILITSSKTTPVVKFAFAMHAIPPRTFYSP